MNKIIKGTRFDTETAMEIGSYSFETTESDQESKWFEEELYMKKNNEFFLHGKGGKCSKYPKEEITPLTKREARKWAEEHLEPDAYETIFGKLSEHYRFTLLDHMDKVDDEGCLSVIIIILVLFFVVCGFILGKIF